MIIKVPNNNIAERKYIIDIMFSDFLGLNYQVEFYENLDYEVVVNDNTLIIKDYFFSNFEDDNYLSAENIPKNVKLLQQSEFTVKNDLSIIFGEPIIENNNNELICHIDIFASSFFMLSRWEEYVIKEKDKHKRFPDKLSLAFEFGFHKRAIVNEYTEFLWNILLKLGVEQKRKERKYNLFLTHDIDFFRRYDSIKKVSKAIGGDLLKRKSPKMAKQTINTYSKTKAGKEKDPYDTFDYLMDISDKYDVKSHFYFIPEKIGEADAQYNIDSDELISTIKNIKNRNHIVGAHFGLTTFNNQEILSTEQKRLQEITSVVDESRQHFLRFENPKTWQILNGNNIKTDSTLGYTTDIGFRCGTCYDYSVFDIIKRRKLNLKEYPLIVMDTALANSSNRDKDTFLKEFEGIYKTVKSFSGNFVFLWHQNNSALSEWRFVKAEYENIIKKIK